ncbi:hypothetical protein P0F40_000867 [Vibrio metschnikovii]|uniref:hypothetical protein n=1 Tax=Vibrio metschnikovii TaxID=28172 RepID=UPI002A61BE1B|nr:hypothetical protein [Vibrio metschnikovii]EKO3721411.1 hypothetical protein [Vibrio metschnikovii]EKO3725900.1 hypothetical protein [Vibrio metschnikovii]EKO3875110.1 hypothetical protein [Vibrio metschnikovii]EKO3879157.1 hypothetical protein [Vibrio metschnikovii]
MNITPKSRMTSLVLTILFGPLGAFYSTIAGGIVLTLIALVSAPTVIGPIVCWLLAIAIGDHCTYKHNKNIENLKEMLSSKAN